MRIKIGGIKEISLVDVIGNVSFVVWFSYCNFRCPWCQNYPLILGEGYEVEVDEVVRKISEHKKFLDFLHVTGGEPTLQEEGLIELFEKSPIRNSLNTNGSRPGVIKKLKMDHIAIDFKAPRWKYKKVIGNVDFEFENLLKSLEIVKEKVDFVEIRTTVVPKLIGREDLLWISNFIKEFFDDYEGRLVYVLQQFHPWETIKEDFYRKLPPTPFDFLEGVGREIKNTTGLEVWIRSLEEVKRL